MPGWNGKRIASLGLVCGLAMLGGALQVGCHKGSKADNSLQAPVLSYDSTVMLATQNQPYTSVTPIVLAHNVSNGIGNPTSVYTSNTFFVSPALPAGLTLGPSTGIISGTPTAVSSLASYTVTAANAAGTSSFVVSLGVQASSPVSMAFSGVSAVSSAIGVGLTVGPPTVTDGTATGYGVSPTLPAGLSLGAETGVITGTPTVAVAQTDYILTATTDTGSANATVTLLVAATTPLPPLTLVYPTLANAAVGVAYTSANPTVTYGTTYPADLFYTASKTLALPTGLPAGLNLDLTSGVISGTPATGTGGSYSIVITASNAGGVASATVGLTVIGHT